MDEFEVRFGESRSSKTVALGGEISVKVSGRDTHGAFAVFEIPTAPSSGPPLHFHHIENEWFYILQGEHEFQMGDRHYRVGAGGSIFGPRLLPHTWVNVSNSPGRMLTITQPAGTLEGFFVEFAGLAREPGDPAALARLFEKFSMKIVGPPLAVSVERSNVT
jgi:mannose-6-phosphate isomerase-like protein (cupin superfamily)